MNRLYASNRLLLRWCWSTATIPPATLKTRRCVRSFSALPTTADPTSSPAPFYTIALDINTQSVGYVLLSPSLHLLASGLIQPPPALSPPLRLAHLRSVLRPLLSTLPPSTAVLPATESYLRSFQAARFHLSSLFTLAEWNTLCCYALYELTGQWPQRIHPNAARGMWGLKKAPGEGAKDVKRVAWEWVDARLRAERDDGAEAKSAIVWRRKGNGDVHPTQFDISDAYLVALTAATQRLHAAPNTEADAAALPAAPRKAKAKTRARARATAASLADAITDAVVKRVRKRLPKAVLSVAQSDGAALS